MTRTPASSIEAQTTLFTRHLCSRIFAHNGYGTIDALIAAIKQAADIPENTEWRKRKDAFNKIADIAPMRDDGFLLKYEDVPAFLATETAAFKKSLLAAAGPRLEAIHISADHQVGLSSITFTEGTVHDSKCDWGDDYPDVHTESVIMLLYGDDGQLLDRAQIDGDTWRDIEAADAGEFYEAIFRSQSISQSLQETAGHGLSV